ncbi:MAG: SIMPL domain-containing protein [Bacteroidetes bacterium]|nr:SIMPL domain-containing protein [Bacteroidota bacterium]
MSQFRILRVVIIGLALVLAAWLLSRGLQRKPAGEYIVATGMAEVNFTSDKIQWSGDYSRTNMELKQAYQQVKADRERVQNYFRSKGVHDSEMKFSTIGIDKLYDYVRSDGESRNEFRGYKASQRITLQSKRIDEIDRIARESMELIEAGLEFNAGTPAFYYTRLSDLKLSLVEKAATDARNRAEKMASAAGTSLGGLKKSSLGVFQITGQDENEEYSWGGVFNTSSRQKTARVTVTAHYTTH